MDFDLDDPLGDLLSDGSNDSFFGTAKKPQQSTAKKSAAAPAQSSSAKVANLFGIDSNEANAPTSIENTAKSTTVKTPQSPAFPSADLKTDTSASRATAFSGRAANTPTTPSKQTEFATQPRSAVDISERATETAVTARSAKKETTTHFDDSDDFLSELGFDPKHPKGSSIAKKSNILDDILNFSKAAPVVASTKTMATPMPGTPYPSASSNPKPVDGANRYSPSLGSQGRPRRTGSSGPPVADTLGLFSTPAKKPSSMEAKNPEGSATSALSTSRSRGARKSGIDWLGLDDDDDDTKTSKDPVPKFLTETTTPPAATINTAPPESTKPQVLAKPTSEMPITNDQSTVQEETLVGAASVLAADMTANNMNLIHVASLEKEQALHSLQQQQTQLRVATQMKQQENILHDMHRKQQTLIKQQEFQFNELLQRQINRQSQLEAHIQQQQQQINAYISTLMSQPSISFTEMRIPSAGANDIENMHTEAGGGGGGGGDQSNDMIDESRKLTIELEAEVKRLGLEKMRLEDTLQSVQTSHEQELDLLHASHKKQISLLEENLVSLEKRLREEIESTEAYYLKKLSALQSDLDGQQHKHEEHIEKLVGDYEKQIERLRLNYEHDLEALQNDQRSTIENIRQVKLFEFAAVQESGSYLQTLKSASDNLELATDNLQSMRTNLDTSIERIHTAKEVQLKVKEKRLNEQQKTIEKNMEKTEEERTRLIELIRSLEIKLNSVEQSATEEQWSMRQKTAALDAERVAFEREKTFTREKLATEEKRFQDFKEAQLTEHKRLMDLLDAEREQILIEKAKLETMERLKPTSTSSGKRQTELDAAIQIAQDAAKSADTERGKFVEQQRQIELKKRELLEKESELQSQKNELDLRISQAKDQKQVADHATKTCKILEQKLLTKLQGLQESFIELTEREAKLSQAKMELGKERMELQGLRQQLRQSKCSLCRIGAQNREISELDPLNDIGTNDGGDGGGGKLLLSKYDIFSSNSFDGLQQRLLNVDAMIDDVIISAPQSPNHRHLFNASDRLPIAKSKFVIDPF